MLGRAPVFAFFAVVGLSALVACHPVEDFEKDRQRAYCETFVRCGLYPNVDLCVSSEYPNGASPYLASAVEAGRIHYDSGKGGHCLKAIRKLDCTYREDWQTEIELACEEAFEGTVLPEEECLDTRECVPGAVCGFDPACLAMDACCPGHCRVLGEETEPPKIGEPCEGSCVPGAFCEGEVCVALRGEGGPCDYDEQCAPPGFCNYDDATESWHCKHAADTNEPCDVDGYNGPCLHARDHCADDGVCRPRGEPGDACQNYDDCLGYARCIGDVCVENLREGEACDYADSTICYQGLTCDGTKCVRIDDTAPELCTLE